MDRLYPPLRLCLFCARIYCVVDSLRSIARCMFVDLKNLGPSSSACHYLHNRCEFLVALLFSVFFWRKYIGINSFFPLLEIKFFIIAQIKTFSWTIYIAKPIDSTPAKMWLQWQNPNCSFFAYAELIIYLFMCCFKNEVVILFIWFFKKCKTF